MFHNNVTYGFNVEGDGWLSSLRHLTSKHEVAGLNHATAGINPVGDSGMCHHKPSPNIPKL